MRIRILCFAIVSTIVCNLFGQRVSPLYNAVRGNDTVEIKRLLSYGVDPNQKHNGIPVVVFAIRDGNMGVFDLLLSNVRFKPSDIYTETVIGKKDKKGVRIRQNIICEAIRSGNRQMVDKLIRRGASVDITIVRNEVVGDSIVRQLPSSHPLLLAMAKPFNEDNYAIADMVEARLNRYDMRLAVPTVENPNATKHFFELILTTASSEQYNALIQRLFLRANYQFTYLEKVNGYEADRIEREYGADALAYARKYQWRTWLDFAIEADNVGMVNWFVDRKIKTFRADDRGASLLMKSKNMAVVKALLRSGTDINAQTPVTNESILMRRVYDMATDDYLELLDLGANPYLRDADGKDVFERVKERKLSSLGKRNIKALRKYISRKEKLDRQLQNAK